MTKRQREKQLHRHLAIAGAVMIAAVAVVVAAAVLSGNTNKKGKSSSDAEVTLTPTPTPESGRTPTPGAESGQSPAAEVTPAAGSTEQYDTYLASYVADPTGFFTGSPAIQFQDITVNPYSRPGETMERVDDIVVHSTDSPGASAQNVRDYFDSLSDGSRSASSNFVIGLDGEIIECVPINEKAYATRWRNYDTISIECCIPDEEGTFNQATYDSCTKLVAWLEYKLGLSASHVIRHYDVTGKNCPRYFVANEDAWTQFKSDVETRYNSIAAAGGVVQ